MSKDRCSFKEPITITLYLDSSFRVGGPKIGESYADLPIHSEIDDETGERIPIIPASSFKGILRKSVRRVLESLRGNGLEDEYHLLFGSELNGESVKEGILSVSACMSNREQLKKTNVSTRTSINVEDTFGSVKKGSLWRYEVAEAENGFCLDFDINLTFPISSSAAALLLAGLRLMKHDFIGGHNSRGHGFIKKITIEPQDFVEFSKSELELMIK